MLFFFYSYIQIMLSLRLNRKTSTKFTHQNLEFMKRLGLFLLVLIVFMGAHAAEKGINMDSLKQAIISNSKEIHDIQKDSVMYSKLTPDQLMELKKQELEVKKKQVENDGRSDMPFNGFELVLICILPFVFVVVVIAVQVRAKKEESRRRYDLYTKSLEMGQTVPDHFFDKPKNANPISDLKKGVLWFVIGLAILISFVVMHKTNGLIVGIVPTFVGIGYLLVHYLEKPKTNTTADNDEQHG